MPMHPGGKYMTAIMFNSALKTPIFSEHWRQIHEYHSRDILALENITGLILYGFYIT
jgi:hypothetical protein